MKIYTILFFILLAANSCYGQFRIYDCSVAEAECIPSSGATYTIGFGCYCSGAACAMSEDFDDCEGLPHPVAGMLEFEASGTTIDIEAVLSNPECDKLGIYVGLMEFCETSCLGSSNNCGSPNDAVDLSIGGLVIGRIYYMYVSPCGFTDGEVTVDISFSGEQSPVENLIEINVSSDDCETPFCLGNEIMVTAEYVGQDPQMDHLFEGQGEISYDISGPENYSITVPNNENGNIINTSTEDLTPGEYTICLSTLTSECNEIPIGNACASFSVSELVDATYYVCEFELANGFGNEILGYYVYDPGVYLRDNELCECISEVVTIEELRMERDEVVFELCPEDYPFVFLNEFEFEYSELDIVEDLVIEQGSFQTDYNGEACDSLVTLILFNSPCENCEVPLSLIDSELVLCIPFFKSTKDLSGFDNVAVPHNITYEDYDDNGTRRWSADFDGDAYIDIPYTQLLESPIFSMAFEFDKYLPFSNGSPIETLVSMGSDNLLRFSIDIEQVNTNSFTLVGRFYTDTDELLVTAQDLAIDTQYDVAVVAETNSIALYIDGEIVDNLQLPSSLNVGMDNITLGAQLSDGDNIQYYNGYMNDFKYWAEDLEGRDILFIHDPLAEFTEVIDLPLTCCEQFVLNDSIVIDFNNPIQSLVVPEASPTGYDSTYVYNFIEADPAPVIATALVPEDITVSYQRICDEFCSQLATWNVNPENIFSDNCMDLTYTQSHTSPLLIDQNNPQVKVVYTAEDICGNMSEFSFDVILNCIESAETLVEENNSILVQVNNECIDDQSSICINANIDVLPVFIDENSNTINYNDTDHPGLTYSISVNGLSQSFSLDNGNTYSPIITEAGEYEICLETITDICMSTFIGVCETISVYENRAIDHGSYDACRDDHLSVIPPSVSNELRNVIDNSQNVYRVEYDDSCGCPYSELIEIENISTDLPVPIVLELCEGDEESILGRSFSYSDNFDREVIIFENATSQSNALGEKCDSLIELTIVKLPASEEQQFVSICEGEQHEGYTQAGTYDILFPSASQNGCDSVLILNLDILSIAITELSEVICPDDEFMGFDTTGIYSIILSGINGCDSIVNIDLTVLNENDPQCISSVGEIKNSILSLYPNPTNDNLYVKSKLITQGSLSEIVIYSYDGKEVLNSAVQDSGRIDVSGLDSGLYLIKVRLGEDEIWDRFIKA